MACKPDYKLKTKINEIYNKESEFRTLLQQEFDKAERDFNLLLVEELGNHLARCIAEEDPEFKPGNTDLLILLLGTSLEPLKLSLAIHRPRYMAVVYTPEAEEILEAKARLEAFIYGRSWDINFGTFDLQLELTIKEASDPAKVYERMRERWDESWSKLDGVAEGLAALDITGGKKPVMAGAFQFAAVAQYRSSKNSGPFPLYYMDFERYDPLLNRPDLTTAFYQRITGPVDILKLQKEYRIAQGFPRVSELSREDKDALCSRLLNCLSIKDKPTRNHIIDRLPDNIKFKVNEDGNRADVIYDLVEICSAYPGGIAALLKETYFFEKDSIPWGGVKEWAELCDVTWL